MQGNGIVWLRNGRKGFVRWFPNEPRNISDRTKVMIHVKFKPSGPSGMFNIHSSYTGNSVPLCETTLR